MLRLMLLRHAKSTWAEPGIGDRDRPLNERGRRAAPLIGRHMEDRGFLPDLVLCSPARRARDTWALASGAMTTAPPMQVEDSLYDFGDGDRILAAVRSNAGQRHSLLVVGHNPSLQGLAIHLCRPGNRLIEAMRQKYSTGALAVVAFAIDNWSDVQAGTGDLIAYVRPRDLDQGA